MPAQPYLHGRIIAPPTGSGKERGDGRRRARTPAHYAQTVRAGPIDNLQGTD